MDPRLFIGSSKEGMKYADHIESMLMGIARCVKWYDDNVFKPNRGTLDTLVKQAKLSDFALLIATKDDVTTNAERGTERNVPRDNVIFEFGLFLGATSIDRAFLFAQKGANLPSDFNGVSVLTFDDAAAPGAHEHIDSVVGRLIGSIHAAQSQSELGFVPSTALAMGYFTNFIKPVCEKLGKNKLLSYNGDKVEVKTYQMTVVLPENIDDDGVGAFTDAYNQQYSLERAETAVLDVAGGRGYPFHFKIDPPHEGPGMSLDAHVFDIPTTLNTILEAIKLFMPSGTVGVDLDKENLERRELKNFANVLRYYIGRNTWTKGHVTILEDVSL
ncbi:nucleotide-binding protein [Hymenobacter sp. ASUV-10]|uniref:CD-NTase-associated protein 12 n=1 Tax=Hymenobacter aranciens TaxID=3063996 RepID=A0ABT9B7U0_9BACT|nr:STING domain-containing protein [Hymenobacter sp. ASUV-10]MDO7874342.1 nucleotide-binding protein [Hymenobacter sp. ASUV-10]